jgi:hypothetical protein
VLPLNLTWQYYDSYEGKSTCEFKIPSNTSKIIEAKYPGILDLPALVIDNDGFVANNLLVTCFFFRIVAFNATQAIF